MKTMFSAMCKCAHPESHHVARFAGGCCTCRCPDFVYNEDCTIGDYTAAARYGDRDLFAWDAQRQAEWNKKTGGEKP